VVDQITPEEIKKLVTEADRLWYAYLEDETATTIKTAYFGLQLIMASLPAEELSNLMVLGERCLELREKL